MKIRNVLPKALALGALLVAAWALVAASDAGRARAQIDPGYMPLALKFGALTLAPGQTLTLNVSHYEPAGSSVPASLSFDIAAVSSTARAADGTALSLYHAPQTLARDLTLAPGRAASFSYTNNTGAALQVRAAAQVAGIDTSPGSSVQGIDTSPTIASLELRDAGKTVAVLHPLLRH